MTEMNVIEIAEYDCDWCGGLAVELETVGELKICRECLQLGRECA
jgi:hypothetical protein